MEAIRKVYQAMENQCEMVCLIDNEKKTFQMQKGTRFWKELLGEEGSLRKLYGCLFTQNLSGQAKDSGKLWISAIRIGGI